MGRPVTLIGLRCRLGRVELHVDGILQHSVGTGATMEYPAPGQIRISSQFNGTAPFIGTVHEVEVYAGALGREQIRGTSLQEFLAR